MTKLFATVTAVSDSKPWFLSLIHQSREFWEKQRNPSKPIELTATPVEVPEIWSKHRAVVPRMLSVLVHTMIFALALIPWAKPPKPLPKGFVNIALYAPKRLVFPANHEPGGNGGGGGRREPTPPSLGKIPRAADKQLAPPDPEPTKSVDPALIVEPSVIAPQFASLPQLNLLNIGDPDGVPGPPSSGPGNGNGIGTDAGHGIGEDRGPGLGPENVGSGGQIFRIRDGISAPVLITQIIPQFSEEARKARFQGRVVLDTIVQEDGSVRIVRVARGIGFGLDEQAIAAVVQWRFKPARMNGKPVPVAMNIEVTFNLR